MVTDPPDGRIPPLTAAGAAAPGRPAAAAAAASANGRADSWLDRSFYDRCITRSFPGSMMPAIYGNAYDITQAPGLVAIRYEMIHETRVIRLDDSPRTGIRSHMGEARGRWEGNTLVVETTNFDPRTVYQNGVAEADDGRAVSAGGGEQDRVVGDAERPRHVDEAVDVRHDVDRGPGAAAVRVRLPRRELRDAQHPERRARRGGARRQVGRATATA